MRLFNQANFQFIQKRRIAYTVSAALILVGIGGMVFNVASIGNWQNYGVDFTGGTLVQVHFENDVTVQDVRSALGGASGPEVTRFSGENEFVIRAPLSDANIDEVRADIEAQLSMALGDSYEISRTELVGPRIGAELQSKAGLAILFSFALTLLYIWVRFELRFGMAAVVATVHDILLTLGFLALFRVEIALPTVAALLTIIGYSLNDTIVVFDRVRENLAQKGARKQDQHELVNRSINETLPRTVLTSGPPWPCSWPSSSSVRR
jgi:preprotein translocase subunit SecF